jgi:Zn finger protein HypA/HybF involved in hydrogenase expression
MAEVVYKGRLNGIQRNRLKSLFDMMYSPKELAEEIGIHIDQVYVAYVPLGCPRERDERNHILINGRAFFYWYTKTYTKIHLKHNETFCKNCKQGVKISQPKKGMNGTAVYIVSLCPNCGRKLTKIVARRARSE